MVSGHLPSKLVYITYGKELVKLNKGTREVYPAFIADSKSDSSIETGQKWAESKIVGTGITPILEPKDNSPLSGVEILYLEKRGEGGRAYKVLLDNKYLVDMREADLLDAIQEDGCVFGVFTGRFVWGIVNSQTRLIMVGSELHIKLVLATSLRLMPNIPKSKLVQGHAYWNRLGETKVYMGEDNKLQLWMNIPPSQTESLGYRFERALGKEFDITHFSRTKEAVVVRDLGKAGDVHLDRVLSKIQSFSSKDIHSIVGESKLS